MNKLEDSIMKIEYYDDEDAFIAYSKGPQSNVIFLNYIEENLWITDIKLNGDTLSEELISEIKHAKRLANKILQSEWTRNEICD